MPSVTTVTIGAVEAGDLLVVNRWTPGAGIAREAARR
jgi:hypothetical protein